MKTYLQPMLQLVCFSVEDVVRTSLPQNTDIQDDVFGQAF